MTKMIWKRQTWQGHGTHWSFVRQQCGVSKMPALFDISFTSCKTREFYSMVHHPVYF